MTMYEMRRTPRARLGIRMDYSNWNCDSVIQYEKPISAQHNP